MSSQRFHLVTAHFGCITDSIHSRRRFFQADAHAKTAVLRQQRSITVLEREGFSMGRACRVNNLKVGLMKGSIDFRIRANIEAGGKNISCGNWLVAFVIPALVGGFKYFSTLGMMASNRLAQL